MQLRSEGLENNPWINNLVLSSNSCMHAFSVSCWGIGTDLENGIKSVLSATSAGKREVLQNGAAGPEIQVSNL